MTAGQQYAIVLHDANDWYFEWAEAYAFFPYPDPYPAGHLWIGNGSSWIYSDPSDFAFRTYVTSPDPGQMVAKLVVQVDAYGLRRLGSSLHDKLIAVEGMLAAGETQQAFETLQSFVHEVNAQRDKGLTTGQADELVTSVNQIESALGY